MKQYLTIAALLLTIAVFSQNKTIEDTNCLAAVNLKYNILDSNAVKAIEYPLTNSEYDNILSYVSKGHTYVCYCIGDKNSWTRIEVPFTEATNDFSTVFPASNQGSKLFIKGTVGKSEIHGRSEYRVHNYKMLIINIDKDPIRIFEANYACDATVIPFDGADKSAYSSKKYERKIDLTDYGLIISTPAQNETPSDGCKISAIDDGTYLFDGVELKKKK